MGFKIKKKGGPAPKIGSSKQPQMAGHIGLEAFTSNKMLGVFKAMAVDMKNRGRSDDELAKFATEVTPESLRLKPDPYLDHIYVQIRERTTADERINALNELALEGKI
jgi:hypothetical protein